MIGKKREKSSRFFNFKTLLSVLLSILGLYLGFRKFDGQEFIDSLLMTNLTLFFLSMVILVFTVVLRAIRWKYILQPIKEEPVKQLFATQMIGYFGNNVFPMRFGEFLRAFSLSKITKVPGSTVFGTIVVERVIDTLTVFVLLVISLLFFPTLPKELKMAVWLFLIVFGLFVFLVYILFRKEGTVKRFLKKMKTNRIIVRILEIFRNFYKGIKSLQKTSHPIRIIVLSIIIWVLCIFNVWIIGVALNVFFTIKNTLLIFFITSAVIAIPSAPGYVGTYHYGAIKVLELIGIGHTKSQAIAVIMHGVGFLSLTLIGLIYFLKYHISIKDTDGLKEYNENLET